MGIGINRGLRAQDLVAFLGDQDNFPLHFSTRIMRRLIFCWQCRQSRAQVESAAETQRERHGKRPRWRLFLVLVLVLVRARQWPRAALTTRASGHIKLKFQLEIAQLLLPVHPWPNCSHAPQQIASAWAWAWTCAWVWAADEARTAVARWKWMLRCPWCDAMCCHVNWQHLRRNLSQDQPADTFNLVRRRDTAEAPMCPNPHCDAGPSSRLADAMRCLVPDARCYH